MHLIAAYRKMNPAIPIRWMMRSFCSGIIFSHLNSGVCMCTLWVWGNRLDNWVASASEVSASKAWCAYLGYHTISLMCNPWVMCSHACQICDASHTKKNSSFLGCKTCSLKKNYLFSMPLSDTCQNEIWEKLLHFKKHSQMGSNSFRKKSMNYDIAM